jgi:hypothetical protein
MQGGSDGTRASSELRARTASVTYVTSEKIDAGSSSSVGQWVADTFSSGGWSAWTPSAINTSKVTNPAPQVVYQNYESGSTLVYTIPNLAPSTPYALRLHFVEPKFDAVGARVLNVSINGTAVLTGFDIFKAAGGMDIAIAESVSGTSDASGTLKIVLTGTTDNAAISAIEVNSAAGEPTATPSATPSPIPSATPVPSPTPSTPSHRLCVLGSQYATVQDDEFNEDASLKYTTQPIAATPPPNGVLWSTWQHQPYNYGINDTYYADPTQPYFGGYNPFSMKDGLNITAEPVPAQYANDPVLTFGGYLHHWLSGQLVGPPLSYGYVEVKAKEPNIQGLWPAPVWLVTTNYEAVGDGPPNLVELDANEIFGGGSIVRQTIHYGYNPSIPGEQQQTSKLMVPDPSTSYHTYGILWTPTTSQFFIDRVANSPAYHTVSTGPMYSMIDLAVFAKGTWAPPPTVTTPQTMNLQYFRWYQTTGQSCSPSNVSS